MFRGQIVHVNLQIVQRPCHKSKDNIGSKLNKTERIRAAQNAISEAEKNQTLVLMVSLELRSVVVELYESPRGKVGFWVGNMGFG